jgi:hypothetical protein
MWLLFQFWSKFSLRLLNLTLEYVCCACFCATTGLVDTSLFFTDHGFTSQLCKFSQLLYLPIKGKNSEFGLFQVKDVDSITLEDALALLQYPLTLVCFPILVELLVMLILHVNFWQLSLWWSSWVLYIWLCCVRQSWCSNNILWTW